VDRCAYGRYVQLMGNVQFNNNKILFTPNNKVAMSTDCCCEYTCNDDECCENLPDTLYVHIEYGTGSPWSMNCAWDIVVSRDVVDPCLWKDANYGTDTGHSPTSGTCGDMYDISVEACAAGSGSLLKWYPSLAYWLSFREFASNECGIPIEYTPPNYNSNTPGYEYYWRASVSTEAP